MVGGTGNNSSGYSEFFMIPKLRLCGIAVVILSGVIGWSCSYRKAARPDLKPLQEYAYLELLHVLDGSEVSQVNLHLVVKKDHQWRYEVLWWRTF